MISARTETAVSSAVRLPMSRPHGAWMRARSASLAPASRRRRSRSAVVWRLPERADVAGVGGQRGEERGLVELRIVGEDEHRVARAEGDVAHDLLRPADLHPRRGREARGAGEAVAGVDDLDLVADLGGERRQRGREVDRSEDHHPRRRAHTRGCARADRRRASLRPRRNGGSPSCPPPAARRSRARRCDPEDHRGAMTRPPVPSTTASRAPAESPSSRVAMPAGRPSP